ncbi:sensor histidine kinase [Acidisphaera rubrifaciens]|uniref:histidine kinase n=1 Tax=Acidisphaera rubrifaciens HS-AP3 TaxID=1231350 RepID=A0A0D6P8J6_9PROT|nr:ATP-binding protein [Acidisphaera rubrifaciens]GAN77538.1 two component sensor histidine kinase [Acidisphaera rubrifaciens HS-AP3]
MFLTEVARSATFRLGLRMASAFLVTALLLLAFIYWQTAVHETRRIDAFLTAEAAAVAQESPHHILAEVRQRIAIDLHRVNILALFGPDLRPIEGNLTAMPRGLPADGQAHPVVASLQAPPGTAAPPAPGEADRPPVVEQTVRAVARRLPDGTILVIGRNVDELARLRDTVLRALTLGLLPVLLMSVGAAAVLSIRMLGHIRRVNDAIRGIRQGDLRGRIPLRGAGDDIDQLTISVNGMLDEIERLVYEVRGVGDNIAHDLRTPLARLRVRLERARDGDTSADALRAVLAKAVTDLDQTEAIITALLRISEIEDGQRRAAFRRVSLQAICSEVYQLYLPVAEMRELSFQLETPGDAFVVGDAELLTEAVANLVDNATKFVPDGGTVMLALDADRSPPRIRVRDDGPGIPAAERAAVLRRFYRGDKSRHIKGSGLGLSLVQAIARLHGYTLRIEDARPGCEFTLFCGPEPAGAATGTAADRHAAAGAKTPPADAPWPVITGG